MADYASIALVSLAVMLLQITLTRVLSVVVWYHWAFLTISLVMLGMGVPGVWFTFVRRPERWLRGLLLAAGIAAPLGVVGIMRGGEWFPGPSILWYSACIAPAMLLSGGAICVLLIKAAGGAVGRMYGVDLLGACLGAALVIPLMHHVPTPHIAAGSGLLPLLALLLQGGRLAAVAWAAIALLAGLLAWGAPLQIVRSKTYDERVVRPTYERWTPTARLTTFDQDFFFLLPHGTGFTWGRGTKFPAGAALEQKWIEQDGSAGTPVTGWNGDLRALDYLSYDVTTAAYQVRQARSAAVIGGGGGRDILSALAAGVTAVDAIELNGHIVDLVTNRFGEFSGGVYQRPEVNAVVSEGRSYLTHADRRYDIIQISLIDSWAASTAGAFALAENNLYTVEAFDLYRRRLTEDGILTTSRWWWEYPRLVILAREHLLRAGVTDPAAHIALVGAGAVVNALVSRRPLDAADRAALARVCEQRGFTQMYPAPAGGTAEPLVLQLLAEGAATFAAEGMDFAAPTDDRPYFFHVLSPFRAWDADVVKSKYGGELNLSATLVLQKAMLGVSAAALLLFFLPFLTVLTGRRGGGSRADLWRGNLFFAAIGAGFMLLENSLLQRFVLYLGHPSYAMTVILSAMLLGMGIGSWLSMRVGIARLRRGGGLVPLAILALTLGLPGLFQGTLGLPEALRIALSFAVLLPLGAILGLFFPLGMVRFGDRHKAWFWAINGFFGVAASVFSLALSMAVGFTMVGVVSAVVYGLAWLALLGRGAADGL